MPPHATQPPISAPIQEIYYEGYLYDVTKWIPRHPGGRILQFYTAKGEDATLPIQQFHNRSLKRTLAIMNSLPKRKATLQEMSQQISTSERHESLTRDFKNLHQELLAEGFFRPSLIHIIYRFVELIGLELLGLYFLSFKGSFPLQFLGILLTAMFAGRCGWLMHEGGHHSITGIPKLDRFLQSLVYGLGDGMSAVWWSSQHNRHHAMPQRLQHDVDLETLPLIAFNKSVVKHPKQGMGFFVQHQAKLFTLIDTFLVTTFWKLYLHPRYALKKGAWSDLLFMGLHYCISLQFGLTNYLIAVWFTSTYIFLNFALSHTHLPVTKDEPLHWVEYALLHTVDIEPSWWCDWWMCYLNYQIEHHLFPTMPQFRHPLVRPRVEALAKKHNIPFQSMSYWDAMKKTFRNMEQVSQELRHN